MSCDQFREQIRIDIAAGENDDDVLAAGVDAAGQEGGEADRAARLDHELQLAKCKPNRGADFGVGGGDALRQKPAVDGEGEFAGDRGHQRVADGAAFGAVRLAFSGVIPSAAMSSAISRPTVPWPAITNGSS